MSDEEDIRRLLASYSQLVDEGDYEGWAALFTVDGTFKPGSGEPALGRQAILALMTGSSHRAGGRRTKHLCFNSLIEVKGGEATAVSDYLVFARTSADEPWTARTSGRHHDRLVKVDRRWLFAERVNRAGA
jgi:uncharacterized protein (TIGR02246 family)